MDINSWFIVIFIIAGLFIFYIAIYLPGYRLVRKRSDKTPGKSAISNTNARDNTSALPMPADAIQKALSEIDDGVIVTDESYNIRYINNAAMKMFGLSSGNWKGLTFIEIVRDHECDALLRKCTDTNQSQRALIATYPRKQILNVGVFPIQGKDRYIVIIKDLTEKQKIEQIRKEPGIEYCS